MDDNRVSVIVVDIIHVANIDIRLKIISVISAKCRTMSEVN